MDKQWAYQRMRETFLNAPEPSQPTDTYSMYKATYDRIETELARSRDERWRREREWREEERTFEYEQRARRQVTANG